MSGKILVLVAIAAAGAALADRGASQPRDPAAPVVAAMTTEMARGGFPGVPYSYVEGSDGPVDSFLVRDIGGGVRPRGVAAAAGVADPIVAIVIADDFTRMVVDLDRLNDLPDDHPMVVAASAGEQVSPLDRIARVSALLAGAPLEPWAEAMVLTADLYGIDWRLIPVIGILESSGGRSACGGNAWGYASCAVTFETFGEGIGKVAETLSGPLYAGKDVDLVLRIWVAGWEGRDSEHALDYAGRGAGLLDMLGVVKAR